MIKVTPDLNLVENCRGKTFQYFAKILAKVLFTVIQSLLLVILVGREAISGL